ncbi:N-6 DNA methylase [Candidatus Saccharibacteria bacterium]|nr:MAG: N-6 DNA methylase [Candidatus Saccharibacteria bacterium]
MSEEILQKGLDKAGLRVGNYEFYNIGATTLNQLKRFSIIPDKDYGEYALGKPDALLVDRRNKKDIKIVAVLEYKDKGKFVSDADKLKSVQQCNDLAQVLGADIGIATDGTACIWINPRHKSVENEYSDRYSHERSFTYISNEEGDKLNSPFVINQKQDEPNNEKLEADTRQTLNVIDKVRSSTSATTSGLVKLSSVDPTNLAKQIWQDVWSVSGATPERCLYTFVELFIFKYLSDLKILDEDEKGNKVSFEYMLSLDPTKAFKNYSENARPHLKKMFPANPEDGTTIINGTVLSPSVPEHSQVFHKLLKKFESFGEMKNIDPAFKSRVFEEFMKESNSKKNWGQYFTPRNIIDSIIQISDIENLEEGSEVCDPACGVGGFLLEPIKLKNNGVNYYYKVENDKLVPRFKMSGFDKGFEKEEQLTIILAKANSLIFLSELLKDNPTLSVEFANVFNDTFKLLSDSILGTLSFVERDKYDLILTNPPYVTSGSSNYKEAINKDGDLEDFYRVQGIGVEGLFMEWIVRSLKPGRKAFIIIPDGILHRLNDKRLRSFIKEQCYIDALISLPINAFYRTPKKTYILAVTKKENLTDHEREQNHQTNPVFTYLVSSIGETLDVNRFPTKDNDLPEAVSLFNQFKGAKDTFTSPSLRCKVQPIDKFDPGESWTVDRWWSEEEKVELGIEEEKVVLTIDEFVDEIQATKLKIDEMMDSFKQIEGHQNEV